MTNINKTLLEFQRNVELDKNLCYKKVAEEQEIFVRDQIGYNLLHTAIFVVSTHYAKSCLLPVYGFHLANGMSVYMRDNFYGWIVSINSPFEFSLPADLVYGDGENNNDDICDNYCEGFKAEWCYPYAISNTKRSTFRVSNDFNLYTVFYHLNKQGIPMTFSDMTDNEIVCAIKDLTNSHKDVNLWRLLYKTYQVIIHLGIELNNNQIDNFCNAVIKYTEIRQTFINEYPLFHKSETMESNYTQWIDEYC